MARPQKDGLDYFPIVTSFDDKINLIIAEFGPEGLGIIVGLYQKIYANGYYIDWNEDTLMLFATRHINAEITRINDVIMRSFERNIFSKELYGKYNILTSSGIQKQFLKVCKDSRRKSVPFIKEYCLISQNDKLFVVITELIVINAEETQQNDVESTQSKVKESKVKENKEKENNNIPFSEIISYLNEKANTSFRSSSKKTKKFIEDRWKEKFTLEDFKQVIDIKTTEWLYDNKMCIYLRPETLFGTKFESYLNQKGVKPNGGKQSIYDGYDFEGKELDF